jgi:NAD(P)-dependent dehydrogenase (short-subunit alcohol dehydrogenase family)
VNNMLSGKTVLVTGASSGIGRAVAIYFSTQGCRVIITGRSKSRLNETLCLLNANDHLSFSGDLSNVDELKRIMDDVFKEGVTLDAVVHCAGIQKTLPLQALKEADFDDLFNVNVKSAQFIAKFLRRKGRYNKDGTSLTFITSVAATCGEPAISTYSASKAALIGLCKSLSSELARNNIRVNCIAPGHVETEMALEFSKQLTTEQHAIIKGKHPLGLGKPEDVAHAAAFLSSDLSRWITGTTLFVDGGYSAQ